MKKEGDMRKLKILHMDCHTGSKHDMESYSKILGINYEYKTIPCETFWHFRYSYSKSIALSAINDRSIY